MAVSSISDLICSVIHAICSVRYWLGTDQTTMTGFEYNGESNLDLQYGMALVTSAQKVTLYQVGDLVEGLLFLCYVRGLVMLTLP